MIEMMQDPKNAANQISVLFLLNFIFNSGLIEQARVSDLQSPPFEWQAIDTADTIDVKEGLTQQIGLMIFQQFDAQRVQNLYSSSNFFSLLTQARSTDWRSDHETWQACSVVNLVSHTMDLIYALM